MENTEFPTLSEVLLGMGKMFREDTDLNIVTCCHCGKINIHVLGQELFVCSGCSSSVEPECCTDFLS